jgi:hypothetical protein
MRKSCRQCTQQFEITPDDLAFYDRVSPVINGEKYQMPSPTFCPACRRQRRQSFRNERVFYKRKCDLCKKAVVAVFPAESQYKVFCYNCWWSDKWDPMAYGRDYDFSRPFFEQFADLEKAFPHLALHQDDSMENSEFCNYGYNTKSCYMALGSFIENVYYSHGLGYCKSCVDCTKCIQCELCYECVDCLNGYNLNFSQDCTGCSDSYFLKDCRQCKNCFCSAGLRNAEYYFNNEKLTREEYSRRLSEIEFTPQSIEKLKKIRDDLSLRTPQKYLHGVNNENVTGDYLDNSSNLKECYDCFQFEKNAYCDFSALQSADLYDCTYSGMGSQLCYEINGTVSFNNCRFCYYGRNVSDSDYGQYMHNCDHTFGCIGLNHKSFCILNKQYSKEAYPETVAKIIRHMLETKEYGEFFPVASSPFPYNETLAYEHFTLSREQALARGYNWREEQKHYQPQTYKVPGNIKDVPDSIRNEILACEAPQGGGKACGRNFRIMTQELDFYRGQNLPIPPQCPDCRHMARLAQRNPRRLYDRACAKCKTPIRTTYAPERPEIVYCESCYLKEVY